MLLLLLLGVGVNAQQLPAVLNVYWSWTWLDNVVVSDPAAIAQLDKTYVEVIGWALGGPRCQRRLGPCRNNKRVCKHPACAHHLSPQSSVVAPRAVAVAASRLRCCS